MGRVRVQRRFFRRAVNVVIWLLAQDQIESTGRTRYARRRKVVVNGCSRAGSRILCTARRLVLDRDKVSARSRCVPLHGRDAPPERCHRLLRSESGRRHPNL